MIGRDEERHEEEQELKVTDKRKFHTDGSLREGVTIEKEESKPEPAVTSDIIETVSAAPARTPDQDIPVMDESSTIDEATEEDILNDEDPSSFINFLSTLVTNAAASLGAMPHPVTGKKTVDLDTGKYWIDVLAMLREKTKGNLGSQEQRLLESILSDLRMQFVALTRASEEKLKAQAAQKFSSKDVLGG